MAFTHVHKIAYFNCSHLKNFIATIFIFLLLFFIIINALQHSTYE